MQLYFKGIHDLWARNLGEIFPHPFSLFWYYFVITYEMPISRHIFNQYDNYIRSVSFLWRNYLVLCSRITVIVTHNQIANKFSVTQQRNLCIKLHKSYFQNSIYWPRIYNTILTLIDVIQLRHRSIIKQNTSHDATGYGFIFIFLGKVINVLQLQGYRKILVCK